MGVYLNQVSKRPKTLTRPVTNMFRRTRPAIPSAVGILLRILAWIRTVFALPQSEGVLEKWRSYPCTVGLLRPEVFPSGRTRQTHARHLPHRGRLSCQRQIKFSPHSMSVSGLNVFSGVLGDYSEDPLRSFSHAALIQGDLFSSPHT